MKARRVTFVKSCTSRRLYQQAWITVAATDSFVLYLNGKAVNAKEYASMNVSGIYDIGHYLHPGKNVLGVVARRSSYPGPAMVVIEGAYLDQRGSSIRLYHAPKARAYLPKVRTPAHRC